MERFGTSFFYEKTFSCPVESSILLESVQGKNENASYDVFLSHSSKDKRIALNYLALLEKRKLKVYIDWINDNDIGRDKISEKLKTAMANSLALIYLHTHNSRDSKWTPWELGYFDSPEKYNKIGVVPFLDTMKHTSSYAGQEYLTQYVEIGDEKLLDFVKNGHNC